MTDRADLERHNSSRIPDIRSMGLNESFSIVIGKLAEAALLLSDCISMGAEADFDRCDMLAKDLREHEEALIGHMCACQEANLPNSLIHLAFLLQRIGGDLDKILNCWRPGSGARISLNGKTEGQFQQLLAILIDMMNNLRDAFIIPNVVLLESIVSEGEELGRMLWDLRSAYWSREPGTSAVPAKGRYLDILDAIKLASVDIGIMCATLLELEAISKGSKDVPGTVDAQKLE
jgi:hypothetical protein